MSCSGMPSGYGDLSGYFLSMARPARQMCSPLRLRLPMKIGWLSAPRKAKQWNSSQYAHNLLISWVMKRMWKIGVAGLAIVALFGLIMWRRAASSNPGVKTQTVVRRTIEQEVAFTGRLRARHRASLAFESTGTLREVKVNVGDKVTAGQTPAKLDAPATSLE